MLESIGTCALGVDKSYVFIEFLQSVADIFFRNRTFDMFLSVIAVKNGGYVPRTDTSQRSSAVTCGYTVKYLRENRR